MKNDIKKWKNNFLATKQKEKEFFFGQCFLCFMVEIYSRFIHIVKKCLGY